MLRLALYQPDIPQNTGAAIRLCACLGVTLDIIEPCGFVWDDRQVRRAAMDYIDHVDLQRHNNWRHFQEATAGKRVILLTTKASVPYTSFTFADDDIILAGRESAGVPEDVHEAATARIAIPVQPGCRSLNVITAAAIVLGEAKRQQAIP